MKQHIRSTSFIGARIASFGFAIEGILAMLRKEPNAAIHLLLTIVALSASWFFQVSITEFVLLIIVMAMVWMAELFNTAIEGAMDLITMERHPQVKLVKDLSAGAVLISSIAALLTGATIFIPKILQYV